MSADLSRLQGIRVLIVEDETLVSMLIEDILLDFGCTVVGTAAKLEEAITIASDDTMAIDVAMLDVNLGGTKSFPAADALAARGVPFVFVSGYGESALEPPHRGRPVIQKPFSTESIGEILLSCIDGDAAAVQGL